MSDGITQIQYTRADFEEHCFQQFGEGRDPDPCPVCLRTGFYGPRIADPDKRFRQCRFCGFTQHADGPVVTYVPTAHRCKDWPIVARAPYLWWMSPDATSYRCGYCRETVQVEAVRVARPVDDENHPWQRVPQGKNRFYYSRFWENWQVTKGRVFL